MSESIPMLLWCPECGARHIDENEYATKPHHTHACQGCGMVWRPRCCLHRRSPVSARIQECGKAMITIVDQDAWVQMNIVAGVVLLVVLLGAWVAYRRFR